MTPTPLNDQATVAISAQSGVWTLAAVCCAGLALLSGCATGTGAASTPNSATTPTATAPVAAAPTTDPAVVREIRVCSGYLFGYLINGASALLSRKTVPNSLQMLPPPPAAGSAAQAHDEEVRRQASALRNTARWQLAQDDAVLKFPAAAKAFSCALGTPISQEQTPHITMLMRRTLTDAGLATYAAKDQYKRTRPFVAAGDTSCTPAEEATLSKDGSYPSGHAAIGWAWGLVLAEVAPERSQALVERGLAFGRSRVVCGVHWASDVAAGQQVAGATVAFLHSQPEFVAQLAAAKAELIATRAKGQPGPSHCADEAAALALDKK